MLDKTKATSTKAPNAIDIHIGGRIKMRRNMINMSQENLGDILGLTFQQVQKYEKGMNRVGGSRMLQIATALQVPVSFFYEGIVDQHTGKRIDTFVNETAATPEGLALIKAFHCIKDKANRRKIVDLVELVAKGCAALALLCLANGAEAHDRYHKRHHQHGIIALANPSALIINIAPDGKVTRQCSPAVLVTRRGVVQGVGPATPCDKPFE